MTTAINRAEPPYLQIARFYRERIEQGELQPGHAMPSVREIAQRWTVANTTAARALKTLQAEGLVTSVSGSGSIVAIRAPGSLAAEELAIHLRSTGQFYPPGYQSTILSSEIIQASEHIANALDLEVGEPVICRQRLVRDNFGRPTERSTCYIPGQFADAAPALLTTEPIPNGVLGYLENRTGKKASIGCDQYAARPASEENAAELDLPVGTPLIIERHWWTSTDGTILQYSESTEPGERWRTHRYRIDQTE